MASNSVPTVLVTRPEGAASERLCATLRSAGYEVYSQPLLVIEALPELPPEQRRMIQDLDLYQHVIFISANAVHFGLQCIEGMWPRLPLAVQWYAVGEATAALLAERGLSALTPGAAMSTEGLLALAPLQAVRDQRVLIVKGEGGRATLAAELTGRGARVDEMPCYRRLCPVLPEGEMAAALKRWGVDVVLISSGEGIVNLAELLRPAETNTLNSLCFIVPSERVARMARDMGFNNILIAENASDAAMLEALEERQPCPGE